MYATLSDLIFDLFGIYIPLPIQTFGFFVAIAFLAAAWVMTQELKRKEAEGLMKVQLRKVIVGEPVKWSDLVLNGLIAALIGFKLVEGFLNYSDLASNPQEFLLSTRGSWWGAILFAVGSAYMRYREVEKERLDKPIEKMVEFHPYELVPNITTIAALTGILGAKIFHNLEYPEEFLRDPVEAMLSFSGLTIYGGLIVASISLYFYAKKHNIRFMDLADANATGLLLGYGIGRLGCHFSGDGDWGIENLAPKPSFLPDWLWAYSYPNNVINEGIPIEGCQGAHCFMLENPVYPTSVYEALACFLFFGILYGFRKKFTIPGTLFAAYLIVNGIERFTIEKIRVNSTYNIMGFEPTQAEIISVLFVLTGIGWWMYCRKKFAKKI